MSNLSKAYPIATHEPGQVGPYRVVFRYGGREDYSYWDGENWYCAASTPKRATIFFERRIVSRSCYNGDYTHFQGLKEKPE